MKVHTRRAVAYITARVISKNDSSSVYDYLQSRHFNMGGEVNENDVAVYDYETKCHISGSGTSGSFSLYHFGNNAHISLAIE